MLLLAAWTAPAFADDAVATPAQAPAQVVGAPAAAAGDLSANPVTITFINRDTETSFSTEAKTVGDFLSERGLRIGPNDYLSESATAALVAGMRIVYRAAVPITVVIGDPRPGHHRKIMLHTAQSTLEAALSGAHVALGPFDRITPNRGTVPSAGEFVRVTRIDRWTEHVKRSFGAATIHRNDAELPSGTSRVVRAGTAGIREVTIRFARTGGGEPTSKIVSSKIVRSARPKIVAVGTAVAAVETTSAGLSFARIAQTGFASAVHLAGHALQMIATAYTAGCYKCSGITASGVRAGFGIIAVDPRVIPLGTHLFVTGYGRAIAGDTGGAIIGHRVDLGMNSVAEAMRFGRRPVTVYVLK